MRGKHSLRGIRLVPGNHIALRVVFELLLRFLVSSRVFLIELFCSIGPILFCSNQVATLTAAGYSRFHNQVRHFLSYRFLDFNELVTS